MKESPIARSNMARPREDLDGLFGVGRHGLAGWTVPAIALHLMLPWFLRHIPQKGVFFPPLQNPKNVAEAFALEVGPLPLSKPPKVGSGVHERLAPKEPPKAATHRRSRVDPSTGAAILHAIPRPDEDLDSSAFATGSALVYRGGPTSPSATGPVPGTVTQPLVGALGATPNTLRPGSDRSRSATLRGSRGWNDCPFPMEAEVDNVEQAAVLLKVSILPDGRPSDASILQDPGHGFGRAARSCAMARSYEPALDREGSPIFGAITIHIEFAR
jgi:periplasmic protein TonB